MPTSSTIHEFHSRVYMPDTDGSGIVYHANYLKFCDQARTEWLRELGFSHYLSHQQFIFVVAEAHLSYRQPLKIDDAFIVESRCTKIAGARIYLEQKVMRDRQEICKALITLATLDQNYRPIRLPKQLVDQVLGQVVV